MSDQEQDTDQVQQEHVGVSLSAKWDKQRWIVMIITCLIVFAGIAMTMLSQDDEYGSGTATSVPTAPVSITKMVPGDVLTPKAQQHLEEADKERATAAMSENSSTFDSAPPISSKPPPVVVAKPPDMPPASPQNVGNSNNGQNNGQQHSIDLNKLADAKLKAMGDLDKRWKTSNTLKFVAVEEIKQDQHQTQSASAQTTSQQKTTEFKGYHIPAGATYFAQLDKSINSDAGAGMVKATIHGGDLDGAIVMGKSERKEKQLLGHATLMTFKGHSIQIDAILINSETTEDSIASAIDDHALSRWGALAGASILEGAATMAEKSGQTMASTYGAPITVATNYNTKQLVAGAVGNIGKRGSSIAAAYFNTPPTLTADKGDEVGIIFATQTEDYLWLPKTIGLQE